MLLSLIGMMDRHMVVRPRFDKKSTYKLFQILQPHPHVMPKTNRQGSRLIVSLFNYYFQGTMNLHGKDTGHTEPEFPFELTA